METVSSHNKNSKTEGIKNMQPLHYRQKPWHGGVLQINLRSIKSLNNIWFDRISGSENMDKKSRPGTLRLAAVIRSSKKVQTFRLYGGETALTDNECSSLSQSLKNLCSLVNISLDFSRLKKLTDEGIYTLSRGLRELSSLSSLQFCMRGCPNITDKSCYYLSQGVKKLSSLQTLDLGFSQTSSITDSGLNFLGQGFQRLTSLECVNFSFTECDQVTNAGFSSLCQSLRSLGNLWSLRLAFWSCHKISDAGLDFLERLDGLKKLALKIKNNQMTDCGMKSLGSGFKNLKSLQTLVLEIECPKVSDSGFTCLDAELMTLRPFSHLYISFNNDSNLLDSGFDYTMDSEGLGQWNNKEPNYLGGTLKTLACLQLLVLRFEWIENQLTDQFRSLRQIELKLRDGSQINDYGLESLGKELKKHPLLRSITLDLEKAKDLTDVGIRGFCEEIKKLDLKQLYLSLPIQAKVTNKGRYMMLECLKDIDSLESLGLRDENGILAFLNRHQIIETWKELNSSLLKTEVNREKKIKKRNNSCIVLKGIYMLFFCVTLYIFRQYLL